jgi:hypothetical protein
MISNATSNESSNCSVSNVGMDGVDVLVGGRECREDLSNEVTELRNDIRGGAKIEEISKLHIRITSKEQNLLATLSSPSSPVDSNRMLSVFLPPFSTGARYP